MFSGLDNYIRFRQVLKHLQEAKLAQQYIFPNSDLQYEVVDILKHDLSNSINAVNNVLSKTRNQKSSKG